MQQYEARYTLRRTDHAITEQAALDALMHQAIVGRVATIADGEPYVIPMNFAYESGRILLHGASQGRFVRAIKEQPRVCFEVDEFLATLPDPVLCDYDTAFASVVCVGVARPIEALDERTDALRTLARKYAPEDEAMALKPRTVQAYRGKYDAHTAVIEITVEAMTGKRQRLVTPRVRQREVQAMADHVLRDMGVTEGDPAPQGRVLIPGELLVTPGLLLKWYELRPGEAIIPHAVVESARQQLHTAVNTGALPHGSGFGFAILHYEPPASVLVVGIWHGRHGLSEARYTLQADDTFASTPTSGLNASAYWHLAPMWHEREAWTRYLQSTLSEEAKRIYLNDRLLARI